MSSHSVTEPRRDDCVGNISRHVSKLLSEARTSTYFGRALDAGHRPSIPEPTVEYLYALTVALERVCIALAEEVDSVRTYVDRLEARRVNSSE